ncbi:MAG: DUF4167 domain-containing protein [Alphaproteobacteria bacterium]|nr:DUF4167 domain-containing protein [Alphaproteobacteria bacterium]
MKHRGGGRRHHGGGNRGNGGGNRGGNDHNNIARQKHHAMQMREKYFNMARDAQSNGDRVDIEYYLQHVDHYVRVLADIAVIEAERYAERQQHAPQPSEATENAPQAEAEAQASPASAADSGSEEMDLRNQPRMTRAPRQPQHAAPQATNEIPLPGSILTEIPV